MKFSKEKPTVYYGGYPAEVVEGALNVAQKLGRINPHGRHAQRLDRGLEATQRRLESADTLIDKANATGKLALQYGMTIIDQKASELAVDLALMKYDDTLDKWQPGEMMEPAELIAHASEVIGYMKELTGTAQ